jgi:hypothetical protein
LKPSFGVATDKMRGHMDASESRTLAALLPKLLSGELRVAQLPN